MEAQFNVQFRGLKGEAKKVRNNATRHHSTADNETLKHFLLKCLCGRILNAVGNVYYSELTFPNGKEADVYDATRDVVIEFETVRSPKKYQEKLANFRGRCRDIFVLYCDDFSDDPRVAEKELRHKLGI